MNLKNLTMTIALFGSMSVYASTATVASTPTLASDFDHFGENRDLRQKDKNNKATGTFDKQKSTDKYLNAPATTRTNAVKTKDIHAGPIDKKMNHQDSIVMSVQQALNELDYNPGKADGIMGANTMAALEKFQRENEITPTGRLNAETLEALQIDNKSMYSDDLDDSTYAE